MNIYAFRNGMNVTDLSLKKIAETGYQVLTDCHPLNISKGTLDKGTKNSYWKELDYS